MSGPTRGGERREIEWGRNRKGGVQLGTVAAMASGVSVDGQNRPVHPREGNGWQRHDHWITAAALATSGWQPWRGRMTATAFRRLSSVTGARMSMETAS